MFDLEWWEEHFYKWFDVSPLMRDLMDTIKEEELYSFIINKISNEFTEEEIKSSLKNELTEDEINQAISELNFS